MNPVIFLLLLLVLVVFNNQVFCIDCNLSTEVYFNNWCYKLVPLVNVIFQNQTVDTTVCSKTAAVSNEECVGYFDKLLTNLIQLYLSNHKILSDYQFGVLKSPSKEPQKWISLIENYVSEYKIEDAQLNVFINLYANNNRYYIENQINDNEQPSIIVNNDNTTNHQINSKNCIFGKKVKNDLNVKFYYENCEQKYPFMCIKAQKVKQANDDCSSYNQHFPGGNWVYCNSYTVLANKFKATISQKCCMYNANILMSYTNAQKYCAKFSSYLFAFNLIEFSTIVSNYIDYLSRNYDILSKNYKFWTSCKRSSGDEHESNVHSVYDCQDDAFLELKYKFSSYGYTFKKSPHELDVAVMSFKTKPTQTFISLVNLYKFIKNLPNKTSDSYLESIQSTKSSDEGYVKDVFLSLFHNQKSVLLIKRRATDAKLVTLSLNYSSGDECYSYSTQNEVDYISIPFINRCYHLHLIHTKQQWQQPFKLNLTGNIVNSIVNIFDLKPLESKQQHRVNVTFVTTLANNTNLIMNLTLKDINRNQSNNDWMLKFKQKISLGKSYVLVLYGYTKMQHQLFLTCFDTFDSVMDLINECLKYSDNQHCLFKCPIECKINDGIVWQSAVTPFSYLSLSNICLAAYHSGVRGNGTLGVGFNSNTGRVHLVNNRIVTSIWPLSIISNKVVASSEHKMFNFHSQPIVNQQFEDEKEHETQLFVMVKPVYFFNKNETSVNFQVYRPANIKLDLGFEAIYPPRSYFDFKLPLNFETIHTNDFDLLNFTVKVKHFSLINRYYQLVSNNRASIKFPINFSPFNFLNFPSTHSIQIDFSHQLTSSLKISTKERCNWYMNGLNTHIKCANPLEFNSNLTTTYSNFIKQNLLFYPCFYTEQTPFKLFTRLILIDKTSPCDHNGYFIQKSKQCICLPGFYGEHCESACEFPYSFGQKCEYSCPDLNCLGYLVCTSEQFGCTCLSGYTGYNCSVPCSTKSYKWGPNCIFDCSSCRKSNSLCNIYTGQCICESEFIKGDHCDQCIDGYYGVDCRLECLVKNCLECDRDTGLLCSTCDNNFHCPGENCTVCTACPNECLNLNCTLNNSDYCENVCAAYGTECEEMCESCENNNNTSTSTTIDESTTCVAFTNETTTTTKLAHQSPTQHNDALTTFWFSLLLVILITALGLNIYIERKTHLKNNIKNVNLKFNLTIPLNNEDFFKLK